MKIFCIFWVVLMGSFAVAGPAWMQKVDLDKGAILVAGYEDKAGYSVISVRFMGDGSIGAVKIYQEPSGKLLCCMADDQFLAPSDFAALLAEKPKAMIATAMNTLVAPDFVFEGPSIFDGRIRIEYVTPTEKGITSNTVCDTLIHCSGKRSFAFSIGPDNGTKSVTVKCYCDGELCTTLSCPTWDNTVCCTGSSGCRCFCGHVECPPER